MKNFKKISEYPDTWSVSQAQMEGKQIFIRYRDGLIEAISHPDYKFQIGVATPLKNPTEDGLTTDAEGEELHVIEDELVRVLGKSDEAVHAMTITHNGMREFIFYASTWKPEDFEARVKQIQANSVVSKDHNLQFMMQADENWDTFKKYSRA